MKPIKESQISTPLHLLQCSNIEIVIIRVNVLTFRVLLDCYVLYKIANMAKYILA